ncbi:MAG: hypothetical protein IT579_21740 [Verrucomicrobia subdivision 3 bacterium]|nr:hypothetical protein [Limisphaerales bacterium]
MNPKLLGRLACLCLLPAGLNLPAFAQSTAFTYQGVLQSGGAPANGSTDFTFTLYNAASGGATVGVSNEVNHLAVSNGLFTVTLDFGAAFDGNARWLEIGVRTNGAGAFSTLSPRQAITASPYAIVAARVSGTVDASKLTGLISPANIGGGSIAATSLAPGAAAANLNASGQAGVTSGGIVLSATENPALVSAGYVKLDTMQAGNFWQPRNPGGGASPPAARHAHTAIWTGTDLIIWGGTSGGGYFNDGVRYNPAFNLWIPISTIEAPSGRGLHTAVWTGTEMIVWGGTDGGRALPDGGRYDPVANTWKPILPEGAPTARSQHTAVWTGKEMLVWGGQDVSGVLNDGARYNPEEASWSKLATRDAPAGRVGHTAIWTGTEMLIWGGVAAGLVNDGGRYDPDADRWSSVSTGGAPTARYEHTAVWTGTEMVIWGGSDGGFLNDGARYLPAEDKWFSVNSAGAPALRTRHTAAWTGTEMIVWGGLGASSTLNDGARYRPSADSWSATPTNGAPPARWLHTAVWTGTEMIAWGGQDAFGGNSLKDGGRFHPAADAWSAVPTNAPAVLAVRKDATVVWTGSEMIVWGGQRLGHRSNPEFFADGWRYNPVANTLTLLSTNGAPSGRVSHTAIWTGSEMIVWGGNTTEGGFRAANDGGRYLPAANLWLPLNTNSAPSARAFHTAVWTGQEMIVWGGAVASKSGAQNSGGRYHPPSDTWTPVPLNNAPTARFDHSAVWTGTEMIVWGGATNLAYLLGDGGRDNPASDVWTAFSTNAAPRERRRHTAVWTGSEMIVWGGVDAAGYYPTDGGRYNPALNGWQAVTGAGALVGRESHTAIWTGREMMIWGGANSGGMGSGAGYDPATGHWMAVTTVGAPTPRQDHVAVWTGKEVLISTGSDGLEAFYNDTWSWTPGKVMFLYQKP